MKHALAIPARGNAGGEERFHFRGDIERVLMPGVEKGLDAKTLASGEEALLLLIPDGKGEFTA